MKKKINYGRQFIDKQDIKSVIHSLKNDLITTGNLVDLFEKNISKKFNCKYAFTCSSGTAGLHLAYSAIGLKKNDIVLMPTINFIASYSMAANLGAKIYLVDVDPISGQITPDKIRECIKINKLKKIKAIITMPLGGYIKNIEKFYNLKNKLNCFLIEDACHAIGAKYKFQNKNYYIGSCRHSDISIFSFHPVKTITTGEGGVVVTNSKKFANSIRINRSHGIFRKNKNYWKYDIKKVSFNYRLSDINCALGISQLKKIDSFLKKRKKIYLYYKKYIKQFSPFIKLIESTNSNDGYHLILVNFDFNKLKSNKDELFKFMNKKGVYPQFHYPPIYKFSFYKKNFLNKFVGTEKYYKNTISMPIYYSLTKKQLVYIFDLIKKFIAINKK